MEISTMTVEQLKEAINTQEVALESARAELEKREQQKLDEDHAAFKTNDRFKKLAARYKKVDDRIDACFGTEELVVDMQLKFTLKVGGYQLSGDCRNLDMNDVFSREVTGKITKAPDLPKKQRDLIAVGLQQSIDRACGQKYDLFPKAVKEHETCLDQLNAVMDAAMEDNDYTFTHEDFNGNAIANAKTTD